MLVVLTLNIALINIVTSVAQLLKMPEIQFGAHTVRSHGAKVARVHMHDWLILLLLVVMLVVLNIIEPFHRFVGKDMLTDLTYPYKNNTIPFWVVQVCIQTNKLLELSSQKEKTTL